VCHGIVDLLIRKLAEKICGNEESNSERFRQSRVQFTFQGEVWTSNHQLITRIIQVY